MRGGWGALCLLSALAGCSHAPAPAPARPPPAAPTPVAAPRKDPCAAPCLGPAQDQAEADPAAAWSHLQACLPCAAAPAAAFSLAADLAPTPEARLATLRAGVRRHPDAPTLWLLLGRAALAQGEEGEGMQALLRARSLRPDDPLLAAEVAQAEAARGDVEARAMARVGPLLSEAAARYDAADTDGALNVLRSAQEEARGAPGAQAEVELRLGLVELGRRALGRAQAHLQTGLNLAPAEHPARAPLLMAFSEVMLAQGRPKDALISASAAATLTPGDPLAHVNVAEARARLAQADAAMEALTEAVQAGLPSRLTLAQLESMEGVRTLRSRADYRALVHRAWPLTPPR
jgi:predicted Zn-dependent protease